MKIALIILSFTIFGCKLNKPDDSNRILTFSTQGMVDVPQIQNTSTAGTYASQNRYVSASSAGGGFSLQGAANAHCDLKPGQKIVTSASYGYESENGKPQEAGQSSGSIGRCASQSGEMGQLNWAPDELCMIPTSSGVTSQLFLMPGQTPGGQTSSLSVTEICELAAKYYLNQAANGLALQGESTLAGDKDYNNITGRKGQIQASLAGESFSYQDALLVSYRDNGGGFGLQGDADVARAHAMMAKNGGFNAFVFTERGFESSESGSSNVVGFSGQDPFASQAGIPQGAIIQPSNGAPSPSQLGLVQGSNVSGLGPAGTFKIYFSSK